MGICPFLRGDYIEESCEMYNENTKSRHILEGMKKIEEGKKGTKLLIPR